MCQEKLADPRQWIVLQLLSQFEVGSQARRVTYAYIMLYMSGGQSVLIMQLVNLFDAINFIME